MIRIFYFVLMVGILEGCSTDEKIPSCVLLFESISTDHLNTNESNKQRPAGLYYYKGEKVVPIIDINILNINGAIKVPTADKYLLVWFYPLKEGKLIGYERGGQKLHRLLSEMQLILNNLKCK